MEKQLLKEHNGLEEQRKMLHCRNFKDWKSPIRHNGFKRSLGRMRHLLSRTFNSSAVRPRTLQILNLSARMRSRLLVRRMECGDWILQIWEKTAVKGGKQTMRRLLLTTLIRRPRSRHNVQVPNLNPRSRLTLH